jgi:hypothetical protein
MLDRARQPGTAASPAERKKCYRRRAQHGRIIVQVELGLAEVDLLIRLGWLLPTRRRGDDLVSTIDTRTDIKGREGAGGNWLISPVEEDHSAV